MMWIRHDHHAKNTKWIFGFLLVFLFMALVFLQFAAAAVIAFIAAIVGLQWLYFSKVGNGLEFKNEKLRKRVLNGSETSWELAFANKGLPIWGGNLKIWFSDAVQSKSDLMVNYGELVEMDLPLTVGRNETIVLKVPLIAKQRGLARLKKMELSVPHPFGEGNVVLEYKPMILQEQLVYPKLRKNPFRYAPSHQRPGQFNLKHSLFEDTFQPIGTRDYVPTDQFNQIHWKASARMQTYQTRIVERVANESILFVMNVASHYATITNLEERIEEVASYIEHCYREGIPYSVAINIRSAGKTPYIYLASGEGQMQRQKALDFLSLISKNHSTMPFRSMLAHLDVHTELPFTTYLLMEDPADVMEFASRWSRRTELKMLNGTKGSESA